MSKIIRRVITIFPAILLQCRWIALLLTILKPWAPLITLGLSALSLIFVLYIITRQDESTYKILWLLLILTFPLPGALVYLLFGADRTTRPLRRKLERATPLPPARENADRWRALSGEPRLLRSLKLVSENTGYGPRPDFGTKYYPLGEDMFRDMKEELEKAEKFILIEYFIVEKGLMWDSIAEILKRKRRRGVDVRVMYDDLGSISTYSKKDARELRKAGIKIFSFNPLVVIKGTLNCRDHRKMMIIDGKTAFSGGVNLADEYINHIEKHGHWKDIGFKMQGPGVANFTRMFAEFWNAFSGERLPDEYLAPLPAPEGAAEKGLALSWYDSPVRGGAVSNGLYIDLLSQAVDYAWFFTPYLMPGDALINAFVSAARRGVDVRVIMPGVPDKKIVYRMSRSFYPVLLRAGVKIYEYTPGFVHAKGCVIDDKVCTVGTVNLDYRSLFLHFENNSLFYRRDILERVKEDFLKTREKCGGRTIRNVGEGFWKWTLDGILRIFAPLC